jgi:hypothetical protein
MYIVEEEQKLLLLVLYLKNMDLKMLLLLKGGLENWLIWDMFFNKSDSIFLIYIFILNLKKKIKIYVLFNFC